MKSPERLLACAALVTVALSGCAGMSQQDQSPAIGAGAAIGGALTGGSTAGTAGGAAVGGVIGNQVKPPK